MNDEQLDKILKKALTPQREIKEEEIVLKKRRKEEKMMRNKRMNWPVLQVPWRLHWHLPALFHRHLLRSS